MKPTVKNWKSFLRSIRTRGNNVAVSLQDAIEFAGEHYLKSGDTRYCLQVIQTANETHGVHAGHLVNYIHEHFNARYTRITDKGGENRDVFKKVDGQKPQVKKFVQPWYEWKKSATQAQPLDIDIDLARFITKHENALKKGKVKKPEHYKKVLNKLRSVA